MRRLLALVVLAFAWAGPASAGPLVAAHRGGAALWPENSLLVFRGALALGVDFLETDVHLTADGAIVVLHDATLDRTTNATGAVSERRLADLATVRLRAAGGAVTDESLPTLAQLLDLMAPSRARLLLEIKVDAHGRPYPGIEDKVLALVRSRGMAERVLIMAFQAETLRRVRALDAAIPTVLLIGRGRMEQDRAAEAAVRDARDVRASHIAIDHRAVDSSVVASARSAGLGLGAWTVNTESDMRRIIDLGVEILISDRPDLATRLRGR